MLETIFFCFVLFFVVDSTEKASKRKIKHKELAVQGTAGPQGSLHGSELANAKSTQFDSFQPSPIPFSIPHPSPVHSLNEAAHSVIAFDVSSRFLLPFSKN